MSTRRYVEQAEIRNTGPRVTRMVKSTHYRHYLAYSVGQSTRHFSGSAKSESLKLDETGVNHYYVVENITRTVQGRHLNPKRTNGQSRVSV